VALRVIATGNTMSPSPTPTLAVLGHFGARKGIRHIRPLIEAVDREGLEVNWLVAGSSFEDSAELESIIHNLSRSTRRVIVDLPSDGVRLTSHHKYLQNSDLCILPYSPIHYAIRGSAIAEEAEWF
jgi:hypothetical protein